jgi:hypothetical protein
VGFHCIIIMGMGCLDIKCTVRGCGILLSEKDLQRGLALRENI